MAALNVDTINDSAGTGAPNFANNLKNGGYSEIKIHSLADTFGSTNTSVKRFGETPAVDIGTDVTHVDSATLGSSFTINSDALVAVTYTTQASAGTPTLGMSVNATGVELTDTTEFTDPTKWGINAMKCVGEYGTRDTQTWIGKVSSGGIIRFHANPAATFTGVMVTVSVIMKL